MQKYAEILVSGVEPVVTAQSVNHEVEKARFEHDVKMKQMEMEMCKAELVVEKEKMVTEQERLEIERAKLQQEKELKSIEIKVKEKAEQDIVKQLKRYGEALSQPSELLNCHHISL